MNLYYSVAVVCAEPLSDRTERETIHEQERKEAEAAELEEKAEKDREERKKVT